MDAAMTKDLARYLSLPYTIRVEQVDATTWFAAVAELPGCMTEANSADEARTLIRDAMSGWIEIALEDGHPVPLPGAVAHRRD
jgi:antitoxin HicB